MQFWAVLYLFSLINKRPCKNCRYYLPGTFGGNYEIGDYLGKCKKFGYINNVTQEINYLYALDARQNEGQCGKHGKLYERVYDKYNFYSE